MSESRARDLSVPPERVLAATGAAADLWGASWQPEDRGGRLVLPVVQGLRRGVLEVRVTIEPNVSGASLSLRVESSRVRLNRAAVMVLLLGAVGGGVVALWPLFPALLPVAPAGAVLALVAWLLVVSRLRSKGVEDFLSLVVELSEGRQTGASGNVPTPGQR